MKKNWTSPQLESLEISQTQGGPVQNDTVDGESWWNEKEQRWETPLGEEEISLA